MRISLLVFLILSNVMNLLAQKPTLEFDLFSKWPSVGEPKISNDGKYVLYKIYNKPIHSQTIVVRSVDGCWKRELLGVGNAQFSNDSRKVLFIQGKDSLCLLTLGSDRIEYIFQVDDFQCFNLEREEWIAYIMNTSERKLVLRSLKSETLLSFNNVIDYKLSKDGAVLMFKAQSNDNEQILKLMDFRSNMSGPPESIWKGKGISNYILDESGGQLAFIVESKESNEVQRTIWYYNSNLEQAIKLADDYRLKVNDNLKIDGLLDFSIDGEQLFFTTKEKANSSTSLGNTKVDIWNSSDNKLQSQQLLESGRGDDDFQNYAVVINIKEQSIIRLQMKNEEFFRITNGKIDSWALIINRRGDEAEESWNKLCKPLYYIISTKTGERKAVRVPFARLSPESRYLIGQDEEGNLFSYELATGVIRDISKSIPVSSGDAGFDMPSQLKHRGLSFWGKWLANDAAMLVYDRYDIWQVDPRGMKLPINLTNGYGRRNNIAFRLIEEDGKIYKMKEKMVLDAFDEKCKDNGFYSMVWGERRDPVALTMGPFVFYAEAKTFFLAGGERPIKARDAECYIVRRSSTRESGNYFWTSDFRRFTPLSSICPERQYNWLKSELIEFATLDGRREKGILYKPEDFDPVKKYPIIIHFYETKSNQLNQYFNPDFSDGNINIPWFVSHGYLVFTPDIHYTVGEVGQSAYNSVVGAGKHLARLPWVDDRKMGISGHSLGGFEVNYIVTHSNLFSAACSDAGAVNFVSGWGKYGLGTGVSLQNLHERTFYRMGSSLLEKPDLYIRNSPIFNVNKVTTPVLLINNKLDGIVHFTEGVQFFTALRRLNKKAWMLQYDGEDHSVFQKRNQRDLTIRIKQFFDHYLKGTSIPKWMLKGISAEVKGLDNGLEYDDAGIKPALGLLKK